MEKYSNILTRHIVMIKVMTILSQDRRKTMDLCSVSRTLVLRWVSLINGDSINDKDIKKPDVIPVIHAENTVHTGYFINIAMPCLFKTFPL